MDYWKECISEALDEVGIVASEEQIDNIAGWVEGAHENYGMAFGYDAIPNPLETEIDNLKRSHRSEIDRVNLTYDTEIEELKRVNENLRWTIIRLQDELIER